MQHASWQSSMDQSKLVFASELCLLSKRCSTCWQSAWFLTTAWLDSQLNGALGRYTAPICMVGLMEPHGFQFGRCQARMPCLTATAPIMIACISVKQAQHTQTPMRHQADQEINKTLVGGDIMFTRKVKAAETDSKWDSPRSNHPSGLCKGQGA